MSKLPGVFKTDLLGIFSIQGVKGIKGCKQTVSKQSHLEVWSGEPSRRHVSSLGVKGSSIQYHLLGIIGEVAQRLLFVSLIDFNHWLTINVCMCNVLSPSVSTTLLLHCLFYTASVRPGTVLRYQIFSVWLGSMGFERAVLMIQVEHDLLIAVSKPRRGKQRPVLTSLGRSYMCFQVHAEQSLSAYSQLHCVQDRMSTSKSSLTKKILFLAAVHFDFSFQIRPSFNL